MLYHVGEEPGISRFEPRPAPLTGEPVVWAVNRDRLRNYLLPRDCPRVTFFAGPRTTPADRERLLGSSRAVVAFESAWLNRVRNTRLFFYRLADDRSPVSTAAPATSKARSPSHPLTTT